MAGMVLVSHAGELIYGDRSREPLVAAGANTTFAELAVVGFFVLSGFLITSSWQRSRSPASYLAKRILRIYPAFALASVFSIYVAGLFGAASSAAYISSVDWRVTLFDVVFLRIPHPPPTFETLPYPSVNGSMWTIRYEFLCYLIAPLLVHNKAILAFALVVVGSALVLFPEALYRFTFAFLVGAAFQVWGLPRDRRLVALSVALFAASLVSRWEIGAPIFGGYLLLLFGHGRKLVDWPDFSYGLYLYGWPIQMMLIWAGLANAALVFLFSLVLASILGLASWYAIESPALSIKRRKFSQGAKSA